MNFIHLTLKKRFVVIVYVFLILVAILFITALNQLKKLKEYSTLADESVALAESRFVIDSMQNMVFATIPHDISFFKSGKSKLVEDFLNYNNAIAQHATAIASSFYLSSNKKIKIKAFQINSHLRDFNLSLDSYLKYLGQKGFGKYGLNGQINILIENIVVTCNQDGLANVALKITNILSFKEQYLLEKDLSLINKIKIENQEAQAFTILSSKAQKLAILSKLQKLEELIVALSEFDEITGITVNDGLSGRMKTAKDQFTIDANELRMLVKDEISLETSWSYFWLLIVFALVISCILLIYKQLDTFVMRPVQRITFFLSELVHGKFPAPLKFKHNDELAEMAVHLNNVVEGLKSKANFAIEIGKGKHDSHYDPLSEDDILGNALIEMDKSLQKADVEDQKYKNEEKKRIWSNEGVARFGEILRQHNNDINKLADEIIQNLVIYLNATQGGLFFYNDDEKTDVHLELVSLYAYDRKKFLEKRIELSEGLIGAVALEKKTTFITAIPDDYLSISSGMGEASPRCILIVPLKLEEEVLGVAELTSFQIFEPHEIEFVEKIGETIASTITSVKINARTAKLLEQSQKQAEEMAEQEEEMRQNMEELRTTQDDFARRESEIQGFLSAIQSATLVTVYDGTGRIIEVNAMMLALLLSKEDDLIGRYHREFTSMNKNPEEYDIFWDELKMGKTKTAEEKIRLSDGTDIFLKQVFTPVKDKLQNLHKVICISTDISESRNSEKTLETKTLELVKLTRNFQQLNSAIDGALIKCEYTPDGKIINVNDNYCKLFEKSKAELIGKINSSFYQTEEKIQFEIFWADVLKGKTVTGFIKKVNAENKEFLMKLSLVPVKDDNGNLSKIYLFAFESNN